jgi:phosphoribosylamine--glycine ligase
MKVLIVGSGGREHAFAWSLAQSPHVTDLICAPGNAGIAQHARCVNLNVEDVRGIADFAEAEKVDLTVVGPERPLILGLVDEMKRRGMRVYGPSAAAARLEGSKAFTDEILARHGISRKRFQVFDAPEPAAEYVRQVGAPVVVKADGDAFGKGVKVAQTVEEALAAIDNCMVNKLYGKSGERVVVEECLVGQEVSVKVFTDGTTVVPMAPAQDYKRIGDGDKGDNTGGMGCYSPVPVLDQTMFDDIIARFIKPTVVAMAEEGCPYWGTLYGGIILTADGPEMLEYNCRFGDPETQVILPRLESDLFEVLWAAADGTLDQAKVSWKPEKAVCVVVASGGYPGAYEKGKVISGLDAAAAQPGVVVFHAGTRMQEHNVVTDGGRVLGVTGLGATFREARQRAYDAVGLISFEGMYCRSDIGQRAEAAE